MSEKLAGFLCLAGAMLLAGGSAYADTEAELTASLLGQPRERHLLAIAVRFANQRQPVPAPIRHIKLELPAGLVVGLTALQSCDAARLRERGPAGCPSGSRLGGGRALALVHAGSQTISETLSLAVYLGPLSGSGQPTIDLLAQGYAPFERRLVMSGSVGTATAPYGRMLSVSIPPIPTMPLEPDASLARFSLALGEAGPGGRRAAGVRLPSRCPPGGFPFAAEFRFADGTSSTAVSALPCP